ncbi:S8 family serine peptidase [Salsuginibacillus kocurii]|uniref:S8 family serine peptidase n=1 Tax=Salsuginibacillus kocurii TaxID=427078 RepID=UPI00037C578F|nr:S8 family serine peptidase [Salsuginibacillus kocurii]
MQSYYPPIKVERSKCSLPVKVGARAFLPFLLTVVSLMLVSPLQAEGGEKDYFITYTDEIDETLIEEHGGSVVETYDFLTAVLAELTEEEAANLLEHESVENVEKDQEFQIDPEPAPEEDDGSDGSADDPEISAANETIDWGMERINAPAAWKNDVTGEGVSVAVIDTGIMHDHPDLNVVDSETFVDGTEDAEDDNGHGTHVAGIIAALDNNEGTVGVAPDADLYAAKVLNEDGSGMHSWVVQGIEWAIHNEIDVINLSVGGDQHSDLLGDAIEYAVDQGIAMVAAAGNRGAGEDQIEYPARYDDVIAVGATTIHDERAQFSATGPSLDIVAPGQDILSTDNDGGYIRDHGTSMAAPHVSGHLALLQQENPEAESDELTEILFENTDNLGTATPNEEYGHGLMTISSDISAPELPPEAPENLSAIVEEDEEVTITWDEPTDGPEPIQYVVERNGTEIATTSELAVTDEPGPGEHTYTVTAIGEDDRTSDSVSTTITVEEDLVFAPVSGLDAELINDETVEVTWTYDDPGDTQALEIVRDGESLATVDVDETSFEDEPGTGTHTYTVIPLAEDGERTDSSLHRDVEITVEPEPEPEPEPTPEPELEPVSDLEATVTADNTVELSWTYDDPGDTEALEIVHDDETLAIVDTDTTSYEDVPPEGSHTYTVIPLDEEGNRADIDQHRSVDVTLEEEPKPEPEPQLEPVSDLEAAIVNDETVQLSWVFENQGDTEELEIVRDGESLAVVDASETTAYEDEPGAGTHTYMVIPLDADGNRADSSLHRSVEVHIEAQPDPEPLEAYGDVDEGDWHHDYLADLYGRGFITGYPNDTMQPTASITRAEAAVILVRATDATTADASHEFTDVPDHHFANDEIAAAAEAGLISGYEDGSFRPDETITRGETAALFTRAYNYSGGEGTDFPDVNEDYFASAAIDTLTGAGIIEGYPDGTFGPTDSVSRAEYAAFLSRTLAHQ